MKQRFVLWGLVGAQIGAALVAGTVTALAPPAHGRLLAIPLPGTDARAADLVAGSVRLLGPGPLPGSLVLFGDRAALLRVALGHGVLLTAAPAGLCGDRAGATW